jgi:alpha-galactosidase
MKNIFILLIYLIFAQWLCANDLAKTPPMGWNSWNYFGYDINDSLIRGTIDAMVSSGMRDAGYEYVCLDDGWQANRSARSGALEYDKEKFPNGIKALADYAHANGLKLGIYSGPYPRTCGGYEGSFGHETEDAEMFASWGIDHLKYDGCCGRSSDYQERYQTMSDALVLTGRDIVYHICHCGKNDVWQWARSRGGNHWRLDGDIADRWDMILTEIDKGVGLAQYAGPGGWNDFDMLVVGINGKTRNPDFADGKNPGCTPLEYRSHFSLWCILDSPLLAGNDLRNMDSYTIETLTNKEVIALNQDSLGIQASKVKDDGDTEIYAKPLQDGSWGIALFNRSSSSQDMTVNWQKDLGVKWNSAAVRDLWEHADKGTFSESYSVIVPSHGVVMIRCSGE